MRHLSTRKCPSDNAPVLTLFTPPVCSPGLVSPTHSDFLGWKVGRAREAPPGACLSPDAWVPPGSCAALSSGTEGRGAVLPPKIPLLYPLLPDGWLSAKLFSTLKDLNVLSETGRGRICQGLYRIITEKLMKGLQSLEISGGIGGGAGQEFRMKSLTHPVGDRLGGGGGVPALGHGVLCV